MPLFVFRGEQDYLIFRDELAFRPNAPLPPQQLPAPDRDAFPHGTTYGRAICPCPDCVRHDDRPERDRMAVALENSTSVLRRLLSDAEWNRFLQMREVEITTPRGTYRLRCDQLSGNLKFRADGTRYWQPGCIHVFNAYGFGRYRITGEENLAAQVLMIRTDEQRFRHLTVWG